MKMSALYAQWFCARVGGGHNHIGKTGEEILHITLRRIAEGASGYAFKDGDILFYFYLCRCCRKTILSLLQSETPETGEARRVVEEDEDTPIVLTEQAAVAFLERRQGLEPFQHFIKDKKLKGKLRAYSTGFPKYGAETWDVDKIANDLRVTPATAGQYRSRLRELLEEFEIQRGHHISV